jgi:hypothetical protein
MAVDQRPVASAVEPSAARDMYVDLLRAGSLLVVVVWHWVFNLVYRDDTSVSATNPIGTTRGMWLLTWVLQVMPVFFIVGGYIHGRALERDARWWPFVTRRVRQLIVPASVLIGLFVAAQVVAAQLEAPGWVSDGLWLVVSPLWFLAVYLLLVVVAPLAHAAHRRVGPVAVVLLAGGSVVIDVARFNVLRDHVGAWAWLSMLVVWGFVHQLGFFFGEIRKASARSQEAVVLAGFFVLVGLTNMNLYPRSLVGVPGERLSNLGPPTLAVCALAVLQFGVVARLERVVAPRLSGARLRSFVAWCSRWSMLVFLWHMPGYAAAWLTLDAVFDIPSEFTWTWWAWRPAQLALAALFTSVLVLSAMRLSRSRPPRTSLEPAPSATAARELV